MGKGEKNKKIIVPDNLHFPVVSIITPSFNRADIVHETAASIFRQTYPHWEWVIVDDGSTDNSLEVLREYAAKDPRVKLLQRDRMPKGACACRNIAVENSTGDYLIFLDTDDLLASFCLEQRVNAAQDAADCDFIIFPMLLFHHQPDDEKILWNIETGVDDTLRVLYGDPICQGTGTIWRKQAFVDIGMWDENLALWQDIDLHLRALLNGLPFRKRMDLAPDIFIRMSPVSLSRTGFHSIPKLRSRILVLEKALAVAETRKNFARYRDGFRLMAKEIFISAVNSQAGPEKKSVQLLVEKNELFSSREKKWFSIYALATKMKLYKAPVFLNYLVRKLNLFTPAPEKFLNTIRFDKKITL